MGWMSDLYVLCFHRRTPSPSQVEENRSIGLNIAPKSEGWLFKQVLGSYKCCHTNYFPAILSDLRDIFFLNLKMGRTQRNLLYSYFMVLATFILFMWKLFPNWIWFVLLFFRYTITLYRDWTMPSGTKSFLTNEIFNLLVCTGSLSVFGVVGRDNNTKLTLSRTKKHPQPLTGSPAVSAPPTSDVTSI